MSTSALDWKIRSLTLLKRGVSKLLSFTLREPEDKLALPVMTGPGKGLWLRNEANSTSLQKESKTLQTAEIVTRVCKPGWTAWDCSGKVSTSSIHLAHSVGEDGFVVNFEPDRSRFMRTYDDATLNGMHNILFLFVSIGSPAARNQLAPPVMARQMSLDEAYADDEIPVPQLIRIDLTKSSALQFGSRLIREQRPVIMVEDYSAQSLPELFRFATEFGYVLQDAAGQPIAPSEEPADLAKKVGSSIICVPL